MSIHEFGEILIHYEIAGLGKPLLLLHAGWGLAVNGFAYQQNALADQFQMIVPDRRGYGRSTRVEQFGADLHQPAVADMFVLLDALKIDRTFIWGFSDGAVVAALMAITQPDRVSGLIFEGGHLYNRKHAGSRSIIQGLMIDPLTMSEAAQIKLAAYHGDDWPHIIQSWATAWIDLSEREGDLYQGRLNEIKCPTLVIHGGHDEHTPIDEIKELVPQIPSARLSFYPEGGHSIHDSREYREACTREARDFLNSIPNH